MKKKDSKIKPVVKSSIGEMKGATVDDFARSEARYFESGATRDTETGKLDYEGFLSPFALERYAEYMNKHRKQSDGRLRDSDNWQKGIPVHVYMKSLWRHFMAVWKGHRNGEINTEDLCALIFNAMGILHEQQVKLSKNKYFKIGQEIDRAFDEFEDIKKSINKDRLANGGKVREDFHLPPLMRRPTTIEDIFQGIREMDSLISQLPAEMDSRIAPQVIRLRIIRPEMNMGPVKAKTRYQRFADLMTKKRSFFN